ncbi:MAG: Hpt domain-containing protein [Oscillospiraceae bacterium]|nr:Hpt domain-containing protein [Oscillospiraceae bacterium]
MLTLEKLEAFGADTREGLARCLGREAFYLRLVGMLPGEKNFARLSDAICAGDLDAAFEAAHALKGSVGNLSVTPIQKPIVELTEHLRVREQMDYGPLLDEVMDQYRRLCEICSE